MAAKKKTAKQSTSRTASKKKTVAKKAATKKKPVAKKKVTAKKKPAAKKAAAKKKPAAKRTTAKKAPAKKKVPAKKKPVAKKKAVAKKKTTAKKKPVAKKAAAKNTVTKKKPAAKKAVAKKKPVAKKPAAKKAPAKKAPVKKAPVKQAAAPATNNGKKKKIKLTKRELKSFRNLLIDLRDRLQGDIKFLTTDNLHRAGRETGADLSGSSQHSADHGTDNFDREFALSIASSEQDVLYEIDDALRRIEEGDYGICELTGNSIEKARLEVIPYTRYSVQAQAEIERSRARYRPFGQAFKSW